MLTQEICLSTAAGKSRYVLMMSDDSNPDTARASMLPYITDTKAHSAITFTTATLTTSDDCKTVRPQPWRGLTLC